MGMLEEVPSPTNNTANRTQKPYCETGRTGVSGQSSLGHVTPAPRPATAWPEELANPLTKSAISSAAVSSAK